MKKIYLKMLLMSVKLFFLNFLIEKIKDQEDGLSEMSISIIDGTEEQHKELQSMDFETDLLVEHIKKLFAQNKDELYYF